MIDGPDGDDDIIKSGAGLIEMAFSKSRVEDRKKWLNRVEKDTFINYSEAQKNGINYSDFINRELVLFSQADNIRSIPHLLDGFKPSQRKVLYACFKKKLKNEIKVAQLAGYIGEHSAVSGGGLSLCFSLTSSVLMYNILHALPTSLTVPSRRHVIEWYHHWNGPIVLWFEQCQPSLPRRTVWNEAHG